MSADKPRPLLTRTRGTSPQCTAIGMRAQHPPSPLLSCVLLPTTTVLLHRVLLPALFLCLRIPHYHPHSASPQTFSSLSLASLTCLFIPALLVGSLSGTAPGLTVELREGHDATDLSTYATTPTHAERAVAIHSKSTSRRPPGILF